MSWTPTKTGIQPVDKALNKLKYHLDRLQRDTEETASQADSTEQDLADLETRASLVDDVFLKAFDSGVDGWNVRNGDGTTDLPSNGSVGGKVLEVDGYYWVAYPDNIIFHPDRLYRMRVRARMTTAPTDDAKDRLYVGVEGVASDGETLVNINGSDSYASQHYVGVNGDDMGSHTLGEWQEYIGYFQGRDANPGGASGDPRSPSTLHESVRYIRPMLIANYDGGDGVMEIDAIALEIVTESAEIDALETFNAPNEPGADVTAGKSLWSLTDRDPAAVGAEPDIHVGTSAPSNTDHLWLDTSEGEPYILYRYDGTVWVRATAQSGDIDALETINGPTEADAEQTTGKSLDLLVDRYLNRIQRAAGNSTTLATILAKMDDVGDLLQNAFYDDGLGKRTFVVGRQGNEHADGDTILFEEPFQNTPTIIFAPGGKIQLATGGAAGPDPVWGNLFGIHVAAQSGGSTDTTIYDYVRAEDLSASGFKLVAKLIERDVTVTPTEEAFPSGAEDLLDTEGDTLSLGGLGDDAGDDEYNVLYDYDISVDSTDSLSNETQSFPGGTISAVDASISEALDNLANDDVYNTSYDVSLDVESDGSTTTQNFPSGSIDTVDENKEITLSDEALDNQYTVAYSISVPDDTDIEVAIESSTTGGTTWTTHSTPFYDSAVVPGGTVNDTKSFTRSLSAGDLIRVRVVDHTASPEPGGGSPSCDPTDVEYSVAGEYTVDVTVAVDHDGSQKATEVISATDDDGTGTLVQEAVTEAVTDSGLAVGEDITVRIDSITETGSGTYTLSVDPDRVEYTTGSADTATLTIEVAIDSKDGAGAWVERVVNTHEVTDTSGNGNSKQGSASGSFNSSAIATGDDVRVRLKSVDVSGSDESSSVEVDPDKVAYNVHDGTETRHSKTPVAGDTIRWDAVAG